MSIHWLLYGGGILLALIILAQFFRKPLDGLLTLLKIAVFGCVSIFVINWLGSYVHFHLPFNPATALTAGILGFPGLAALITLKLWIFPG
ncbi:pro-sigmaK processing inhibitor BofA family protein [Alicyclobacillus tolerans]|uniref:Inhibitor of the pro-sigma K processing machinery n=2 Tax=Alicyclobacillus tolerans TaxID=90970 RepID=A0A1M6PKH1_9BACL|nr:MULTISPECIES: pro-sigmaK processing inhibitor BofA family protein [Alicyclobacillus]MDP9729287.1 inhibitor of the pro-sigma K processing machinery [Alicyclobacillus tengchongensis]SHK08431.1 inhibitor of the pro-sigma K processing machinery [Alicyclobacillus montanus]